MKDNLEKLQTRYPQGKFDSKDAQKRVDVKPDIPYGHYGDGDGHE